MKRHSALVPLSHDHHHGLVEARRLRRAADAESDERREAAAAFALFFADETRRHFREEEEGLFPLLVGPDDEARELLVRALLEHQHLHALRAELDRSLEAGEVPGELMRELAERLHDHIRFEERTLFPAIEQRVAADALDRLAERGEDADAPPEPGATGPLWGTETEDLNATLLAWGPGAGPGEHVNEECDVLLVVLAGGATVTVDGDARLVRAGDVVVVEKGRSRALTAGPAGVRYLSVHRRRAPLRIAPAPRP